MTKKKVYEYSTEEILDMTTQLLGKLVACKAKGDPIPNEEIEQVEKFTRMIAVLRKEEREAAMEDAAGTLSPEEFEKNKSLILGHLKKKYGT